MSTFKILSKVSIKLSSLINAGSIKKINQIRKQIITNGLVEDVINEETAKGDKAPRV